MVWVKYVYAFNLWTGWRVGLRLEKLSGIYEVALWVFLIVDIILTKKPRWANLFVERTGQSGDRHIWAGIYVHNLAVGKGFGE